MAYTLSTWHTLEHTSLRQFHDRPRPAPRCRIAAPVSASKTGRAAATSVKPRKGKQAPVLAADEWEEEEDEQEVVVEEERPAARAARGRTAGVRPKQPAANGGGDEGAGQPRFRRWLEERLTRDGQPRRYLSEEELLQYRNMYQQYMGKRSRGNSKQITLAIKKADTWQQVQDILLKEGEKEDRLDEIHYAAAVGRMCFLYEKAFVGQMEMPEFRAYLDQVLASLLAYGQGLKPQEISLTLYNIAKLEDPPQDVLQNLLVLATEKLRSFNPTELTNTLYALARMSVSPGDKWLASLLQVSYPLLGQYKTVELANSVFALGRLGHVPDPYWQEAFFKETFHKFSSFSPREVANMLFGLGLLGAKPDTEWLSLCTNYTYQRIQEFQLADLKRTIWAMAQFDHIPNATWQGEYLKRLVASLRRCVAEDLVTILRSIAYLRFDVSLYGSTQQFFGQLLDACYKNQRYFQPEDVQLVNTALAALGSAELFNPAGRGRGAERAAGGRGRQGGRGGRR